MSRHRSTTLPVACLFAAALSTAGQTVELPQTSPTSGPEMFRAYCADCHGSDAKGRGPIAGFLKIAPPDVTTLSKRNHGEFPYDLVYGTIEGKTHITSHGSPEMPVWGPVFRTMGKRSKNEARQRAKALTEFLSIDGLAATRKILALPATPTRVLVLTTFDQDEYVFEALRAGASGFLLKTAPADQLVAGVREVAAGEALLAPTITRRLIERFAHSLEPSSPCPRPVTTSSRRASGRCCCSWRAGWRMPRSPPSSSSSPRRSRPTSRPCSPSSASAIASAPSCSPTSPAWSAGAARSAATDETA